MPADSLSNRRAYGRIQKGLPIRLVICLVILGACSPASKLPTQTPPPRPTLSIPLSATPIPTQTAPASIVASPTPTSFPAPRTDCKERYATNPTERDYWPTTEWRVSTLAEHCMDPARVAHGVWYFERGNISGSLLIVRHGELVYEKYFRDYLKPDKAVKIYSVTKSVFSALVGIAMDQGVLDSLDHKVSEYFPEYFYPDTDPRMYQVTLRHLLTMSTGSYWEELGKIEYAWMNTDNWVEAAINLDFDADPGVYFNYCTANTQIMSGVLTKLTGQPLKDYAQDNLFTPLGITDKNWSWSFDGQGYAFGGFGMFLRPRDMARFGYLYLNQGYWDGKQVISAKWVNESTRSQIKTDYGREYGYLWWIHPRADMPSYEAQGSGGQSIYIVPDLDMVVVVTGNASGVGAPEDPSPLIYEYFMKAVTDR